MFVKSSGRKGEPFGYTVIMGKRNIIIIVRRRSHADVGPLIGERRFGVYLDKSAHRVTPVKCSLRSAKYVDTFDVAVIEIEGGFVYIRDIIYIKSYGRCVDT